MFYAATRLTELSENLSNRENPERRSPPSRARNIAQTVFKSILIV
jgi:hypothetical protein